MEAVKRFQQAVLEAINEVSPDVRAAIVRRIEAASVAYRATKPHKT